MNSTIQDPFEDLGHLGLCGGQCPFACGLGATLLLVTDGLLEAQAAVSVHFGALLCVSALGDEMWTGGCSGRCEALSCAHHRLRQLGRAVAGIHLQLLQSPVLRKFHHMDEGKHTGVLVARVDHGVSAHSVLQSGDVLLEVDGYKVANDGTCILYDRRLALIGALPSHRLLLSMSPSSSHCQVHSFACCSPFPFLFLAGGVHAGGQEGCTLTGRRAAR
ncbi:hypothetical protein CYMTET_34116 [Cymbomonas tetramitiformis]|uniref:PDZ domain-containing protein n=1 Tax=Cymbomonas tetramitiformis TaxID=36881 RepID=A0AAE0FBK2_9CHLO|nr:hypothetical protein CYMTET_34116 [Cymbomonas tetramitiformis]